MNRRAKTYLLETAIIATGDAANPARHPMSEAWPLEAIDTMTLVEHDGKTKGFAGTSDNSADYLAEGWL